MKVNIPGLLGRLAGIPEAINSSLLGPLPVDPQLEARMGPQIAQARRQASTNMAAGMMAGDPRGPGFTLNRAQGIAQEGFQGRLFDLVRQNEMSRIMQEREDTSARHAGLSQIVPPEMSGIWRYLDPQVQQEIIVRNATAKQAADKDPTSYEEFERGPGYGMPDGPEKAAIYTQWMQAQKKAGAPGGVSVMLPGQDKFADKLGELQAEQLTNLQSAAQGAVQSIEGIYRLEPLVNSDKFISGTLGSVRLEVAKALGLNTADTEAYFSAIGRQVGENIKLFGAGTGLSDADREFAQKMAGGSIELTPAAIKQIMRINEVVAKDVIRKYQQEREFFIAEPGVERMLRGIDIPQRPGPWQKEWK